MISSTPRWHACSTRQAASWPPCLDAGLDAPYFAPELTRSSRCTRVLIVDDEVDERCDLVKLLALQHFEVDVVRSGAEALTRTRSSAYQAIVLDLHLPDILGITLLSLWRCNGLRVPVIAVTGWYIDTGHEEVARTLGAAAFLHKPLDADELAVAIDAAVRRTTGTLKDASTVKDAPRCSRVAPHTELDAHVASLHDRVLCGDAHATAEIWSALLRLVEGHLRASRIPGASDEHVHDAVNDALLAYVAHPTRYDPKRGPLAAYLRLAARKNLINILQSDRRRVSREAAFAVTCRRLSSASDFPESRPLEMLAEATKDFTAAELAVLHLWLTGERDSSMYATELSLKEKRPEEMRACVKTVKERVIRRLQRWASRVPLHKSPGTSQRRLRSSEDRRG